MSLSVSSFWQAQEVVKLPKKQMYRMRAHSNPLNDATFPVPLNPDHFDWCARCH
jgi:tRNA (guanine-N7-)-methyltransferase